MTLALLGAAGLWLAGSACLTIALCHGARLGDQQDEPASDPVRQAAETSGLIPRQGASS